MSRRVLGVSLLLALVATACSLQTSTPTRPAKAPLATSTRPAAAATATPAVSPATAPATAPAGSPSAATGAVAPSPSRPPAATALPGTPVATPANPPIAAPGGAGATGTAAVAAPTAARSPVPAASPSIPVATPPAGPTMIPLTTATRTPAVAAAPVTATVAPAPQRTPLPPGSPLPTMAPQLAPAPPLIAPAPATVVPSATTGYLDDRSDPAVFMASFVNSINNHEYLRTYSYWAPGAMMRSFTSFAAGYRNTQSVTLDVGAIRTSSATGLTRYYVPVTMRATTTGGGVQTFVGCYRLRLRQPAGQTAPPFRGLAIESASVVQIANSATLAASRMATMCGTFGALWQPPQPLPPDVISQAVYRDNRSDALSVLRSLFSAVNRKEYVRAYSYWKPGAVGLPPYAQFAQGYANTTTVLLAVGEISEDVGAGQHYYSAPVTLVSTLTNGQRQLFVGCYTLHLGLPSAQATPPYQPLAVERAVVNQVASDADTAALMRRACAQTPPSPMPGTATPTRGQPPASPTATAASSATPGPDDIGVNLYIDDRSDGLSVIRSFFNAINRKEYVRAYSYWKAGATGFASYTAFERYYVQAASVQISSGTVTTDAGAGQLYYQAPVIIVTKTTAGPTQTAVGCYTLQLAMPSAQAAPPFQPLAIRSAVVRQVATSADARSMLATICQ